MSNCSLRSPFALPRRCVILLPACELPVEPHAGIALFIRIDRLLVLVDDANIDQHRQHVRNRIDVNDLVVLERQDRKPVDVDFLTRSEEHTSELQSLMRISYAVFCLKKKKKIYINTHTKSDTTKNIAPN